MATFREIWSHCFPFFSWFNPPLHSVILQIPFFLALQFANLSSPVSISGCQNKSGLLINLSSSCFPSFLLLNRVNIRTSLLILLLSIVFYFRIFCPFPLFASDQVRRLVAGMLLPFFDQSEKIHTKWQLAPRTTTLPCKSVECSFDFNSKSGERESPDNSVEVREYFRNESDQFASFLPGEFV